MTISNKNTEKKNMKISYFDKNIFFTPENEHYEDVKLPEFYGLSIVGKQILKHINPKFNEKYYIWLKENYKIRNYKILE
jgi:hypothetical protein